MSQWNPNPLGQRFSNIGMTDASAADSPAIATFFNAVYGWMAAGLGLTALVAWLVSNNTQALRAVLNPAAFFMIAIAELGLVVVIGRAINRINANVATLLFLVYAALNGLMLSVVFLIYASATITSAFFVTAGTFAAMSAIGMFTRRDLTQLGSILIMALIGLIIASVVNIFFASSGLYWLITYAGVLIFVGLTAYDTQRLKYLAVQSSSDGALAARLSIIGALRLYLDFVNLFLMILRILGNRRR